MSYVYLTKSLHSVAEGAKRFFKDNWGISQFQIEKAIDRRVGFRPTLHAVTRDSHYLCVEVAEAFYPGTLDEFVVDCMRYCLPVKLFVAVPSGLRDENHNRNVSRARTNGVGILEISPSDGVVVQPPLSLSLCALRQIEKKKFSVKYRYHVSHAEEVFRNGEPAKGVSILYDEIEALCRRIAKKTKARGLWRSLKAGEKPPKVNLDKDAWERVMRTLIDHLDFQKCSYIRQSLLGRVWGITSHRNESSHKPKTVKALIKRDGELRTRFETAADILLDLSHASGRLKV